MALKDEKDAVRKAFVSYVNQATAVLNRPQSFDPTNDQGAIKLAYITPIYRLRSLVEKLESSPYFKNLFSVVVTALNGDSLYALFINSSLKSFFRRSQFYADIYEKKKVNKDLFDLFWSLLPMRKVKTTRLRLIGRARFQSRNLNCGQFRIQRFTKERLDRLIDRPTRSLFYPDSEVDTKRLSRFWFVVEETVAELDLISWLVTGSIDRSDPVERTVPDQAIQLLALQEASARWFGPLWIGVTLPFSFEATDDLFAAPHHIAMLPPFLDELGPSEAIEFDKEKEIALKNLVGKVQNVLNLIGSVNDWSFIQVAMGYLAKAFVTHEGLDQILWHVAVLDALLSEENAGIRSMMKPRIGKILGSTEAEHRQIGRRFDDLYKFRSDLVHGKKYTKPAQTRHLAEARDLAQRALLWFLDYLLLVDENLRRQNIPHQQYPTRRELLAVLDSDKASRDRLGSLIAALPEGFPQF
jgi:Apea-like HEPN